MLISCKSTGAISEAQIIAEPVKEETVVVQVEKPTPKIPKVTLTVLLSPNATTKHVAFSSAYKVQVKDESGALLENFSVTVKYPVSRNNDDIVFATKEIITNNEGEILFTPDVPVFSFDEKITFYPTIQKDKNNIEYSVSSPFIVKTNLAKENAIVYVFDFDENGKVLSNSLAILRELINSGVKSGNSPISSASYVNKSLESLYKATYPIVGLQGFMVTGTVTFEEPVTQVEDVFECKLKAQISCLDMKDGKVLYSTTKSASAKANTKQKAIQDCKKVLAQKTVRSILYSM